MASNARTGPDLASAAAIFGALGDWTRLRLVRRLSSGGPASITQLSAQFEVTRQAVTKHLRVLEHAGLVRGARRGRERVWTLQAKRLDGARSYLEHVSRQWDDALARLQTFVED